eukprot:COSAG06_NODE_823_length_12076_cov_7.312432_2_plen_195_part_00
MTRLSAASTRSRICGTSSLAWLLPLLRCAHGKPAVESTHVVQGQPRSQSSKRRPLRWIANPRCPRRRGRLGNTGQLMKPSMANQNGTWQQQHQQHQQEQQHQQHQQEQQEQESRRALGRRRLSGGGKARRTQSFDCDCHDTAHDDGRDAIGNRGLAWALALLRTVRVMSGGDEAVCVCVCPRWSNPLNDQQEAM